MEKEIIAPLEKNTFTKSKDTNTNSSSGCCGGAPTNNADACCRLDEEKQAEGGEGCGCSTSEEKSANTSLLLTKSSSNKKDSIDTNFKSSKIIQETVLQHNKKAALTWGSGGINYDRISHSISDAIEHCVNRIAPAGGENILDAATGTGWAARLLANREANVTGIDIGTELIEAAIKLSRESILKIDYEVGDAEALSFPDGSFDAVISTFGVMFVNDPEAAAAEIARVCKPGGRIGLTTWSPEGSIYELFKLMKRYQSTPATPPPSPFAWGDKERISELFGSFFDLKFETGVTYLREPTGLAVWNLFVEGYGPTKILAASLDDKQMNALKKDFISFHETFKSELGIAMPREYLVTIGTRR